MGPLVDQEAAPYQLNRETLQLLRIALQEGCEVIIEFSSIGGGTKQVPPLLIATHDEWATLDLGVFEIGNDLAHGLMEG